jgi:phosphoglycerate kinase
MKCITEVKAKELTGKRTVVRVGFDVPISDGKVSNDFRIREALPTLEYLKNAGARIVLISHLGRNPHETLAPVAEALAVYMPVRFVLSTVGSEAHEAVSSLGDGEVLLLENLRSHEGESKNDPVFGKELASLGDIYVNEAFSVAHRTHASVVGIPVHLPSYAGIGFAREVEKLTSAFSPTHPSVFVIGGAKFDTKLPLVKKFAKLYDRIYICGALAHDVWEARGVSVGGSLVSDTQLSDADIIQAADTILTPIDVRVQSIDGTLRVDVPERIGGADIIMDIGPRSVEVMLNSLPEGGTLLWNGPLGFYERGFTDGTEAFAGGVAEKKIRSLVGGGDTVASIEKLGLNEKFTHVSTGGGAMLEFLEKGTLPGIEVLGSS